MSGQAIKPQSVLGGGGVVDPAMAFFTQPPATPPPAPASTDDLQRNERGKGDGLLPLTMLQPNPENPRASQQDVDELGDDLKAHGQLQNINVMTLKRFLEEKPYLRDHEKIDHSIPYVVVNGCLRLEAAPEAGLDELEYVLRDHWTADDIDECVIAENEQRTGLNPMLLARKLGQMLERPKYGGAPGKPGSARKLGKALNKAHPWVPERLNLLKLTPVLQTAVEAGVVRFNIARRCAGESGLHPELQPELASGALPQDVVRVWLITEKIGMDEQMRRWKAGPPFSGDGDGAVSAAAEEGPEPSADAPKPNRPKPLLTWRLMGDSIEEVRQGAAKLREQLTAEQRDAFIEELTSAS